LSGEEKRPAEVGLDESWLAALLNKIGKFSLSAKDIWVIACVSLIVRARTALPAILKPLHSVFAGSIFLVAAPPTLAGNPAEALEAGTVEVVSTTPLPSIGTPVDQVPANVQTASYKAIAQQRPLDISEFMDSNLGSVSVSNSVANPYQPDVSFRGFTASPLLGTPQGLSVFMDGVRVNEPFGDIVNWDLITPNAIASINLIPGSNPLFGLNTLGGALSVHTKSGKEFPGMAVTAYGGSWGRRAVEFELGGENKARNLDWFVAGNVFKEDGWRQHSSSDVKQLFSKLGWQNDTTDLDFSALVADTFLEGTQALPRSMFGNRRQPYTYPDHIGSNLAMFNLKGSHFLSDDRLIAGNVYYRRNRIGGFNSNAESTNPDDISNVQTTTDQDGFGGSLQLTLLGDLAGHKNQFTIGASADMGRTRFNSDTSPAELIGRQTVTIAGEDAVANVRLRANNDYYGLYATDTFSVTDRLHLTASGRYNIAKIRLDGASFNEELDGSGPPYGLNGKHRYNRFNPAVGVNYTVSDSLGVYGGYNEGMRAATPVELSCANPDRPCALPNAFAGDPPLNMVVAKTFEGGFRGRLGDQVQWNAAAYRTENRDDIQFISANSTSTLGYFQNVGKTLRQGFELGVQGRHERLTFAANYGFVDATYQTPFAANAPANSSSIGFGTDCGDPRAQQGCGNINVRKGDRITGVPRQTLKLRLGYDITDRWRVGSNVLFATGQYARGDENNKDVNGRVPGYAVMHLDTSYRLDGGWKIFAKVNNVFDTRYSTFGILGENILGRGGNGNDPLIEQFRSPAAPRAGWVGITYEIGREGKQRSRAVDRD